MLGGTAALEASPSPLVGPLLQGSMRQEEMKGLSIIGARGRAQAESMSLSWLTPSCSSTLITFYQVSKLRLRKKCVYRLKAGLNQAQVFSSFIYISEGASSRLGSKGLLAKCAWPSADYSSIVCFLCISNVLALPPGAAALTH